MNKILKVLLNNKIVLAVMRYHTYRIVVFLEKIIAKHDIRGKKILDIGAENSPYKKYFKHLDYFSQDIQQNDDNSIDYVCDINDGLKGIKNESFDYILCTQVLEHIKAPHMAFSEFNRILKKDGKVFLTTHLCFEEHMIPYDYFRFTKYGLKYLGESNGLKLKHIAPHGGTCVLFALIITTLPIKIFLKRNSFSYYAYLIVFSPLIIAINIISLMLDYFDKNKEMTINYECIYEKTNIEKVFKC